MGGSNLVGGRYDSHVVVSFACVTRSCYLRGLPRRRRGGFVEMSADCASPMSRTTQRAIEIVILDPWPPRCLGHWLVSTRSVVVSGPSESIPLISSEASRNNVCSLASNPSDSSPPLHHAVFTSGSGTTLSHNRTTSCRRSCSPSSLRARTWPAPLCKPDSFPGNTGGETKAIQNARASGRLFAFDHATARLYRPLGPSRRPTVSPPDRSPPPSAAPLRHPLPIAFTPPRSCVHSSDRTRIRPGRRGAKRRTRSTRGKPWLSAEDRLPAGRPVVGRRGAHRMARVAPPPVLPWCRESRLVLGCCPGVRSGPGRVTRRRARP